MASGADVERWYSAKDLAGFPGVPGTERGVRMRAERDGWTARKRGSGKGREYALATLPPETQAALLLRERPAVASNPTRASSPRWTAERIASAWQRYEAVPGSLKQEAERRLKALHAVSSLTAAGLSITDARASVAAQMQRDGIPGSSVKSLERWQAAVRGAHVSDWLALLVPHYVGRTATAELEPAAWDLFKADYLRLEQPSAASCYDRLRRIAAQHPEWAPLPSLRTLMRRIESELPRQVVILARQGEEALMRTYPAQERDRSGYGALEAVNADGHRFDVFVRLPDGSAVVRPVLVGFQDLGSGKMLAWRLGETESSDLVRLAFADMVGNYGIPSHVYLDNGRSFASKYLTGGVMTRYRFRVRAEDPVGVMTRLVGAEGIHWVTPYHGQAKPIERAWRDLADRIARHPAFAGAYVGNNPTAKPENYGSRAIEWAEFERVVAEEIVAHNARDGRRAAICAGRSFDAVFAEKYERTTVRKATAEQLRTLLLAAEAVTASREDGSVRLAGNRYWTEALSAHAGRRVVLRFDPLQLHQAVDVYALDDSYIGRADCVASVGFADANAARDHARGRTQWRRAAKAMLAAERRMDAAEMAAQLPGVEPPELPPAAVIAPVFGTRAKTPEPDPMERTGTDDEGPSALDLEMYRRAIAARENAI